MLSPQIVEWISNFSVKKLKGWRKEKYNHVSEKVFLVMLRMNKISAATLKQDVTQGGTF